MRTKLFLVFILIIFMLSLSACGVKSKILGEWQHNAEFLRFEKDNVLYITRDGVTAKGTYGFPKKNLIKMHADDMMTLSTSMTWTITIEDEILTLELAGLEQKYKRIK